MDDINYEPDCSQLYEQAGILIWKAIEEAKQLHRDGKGGAYTNRQIILMGIQAGAKVVATLADAELNIDQQIDEILGR